MITSTPASPIRPARSTVTLTCIVELSPAVGVPVNMTIWLNDPAGRTLTTTTPSVSGFTYTIITMITSFGRNQSGEYTCTAVINLVTANSFIVGGIGVTEMARITIGTGRLC